MKRYEWQHIEFIDGSNPYICKTEKEFNKIKRKYVLEEIEEGFWKATDKISYSVVGFKDKTKMANFHKEYQLKSSAMRVIKKLKEKGYELVMLRKEERYLENNEHFEISSSTPIAEY